VWAGKLGILKIRLRLPFQHKKTKTTNPMKNRWKFIFVFFAFAVAACQDSFLSEDILRLQKEKLVRSKEPVIISSSLTSKDAGATWDISVTIQDKGKWVEKVVYEFVKPFAGPAPLVTSIPLVRTGEAPDNVEVYSATGIKFEKNPAGATYGGLIYQYGIGTRITASQANNKAELL